MGKLEEAREFFAGDLFATRQAGVVIEEVGEDRARCSMKLTGDHRNAYGGVMGGAIYTLADLAFAVASNFGKENATVSMVSQANFLSMSKGEVLYADAELVKDGRSTCFYEVRVSDDTGKLIAVVSFTGAHLAK